MKKFYLFAMLVIAVVLISSCASPAPAAPAPEPVSQPQPQPQQPQAQPQPQPQAPAEASRHRSNIILEGAVKYTVRSGDILAGIGKQFYSDGSWYPLIMMVSDDVVKDPDVIEPGMVLTIPDLNRNIADARAKNSINAFFPGIADIEEKRGRHATAVLIRNHAR